MSKQRGAQTTNYVWTARDLLASVSRDGQLLGSYSSDYSGMRVSKEAVNPLTPGAPARVLRTQWDGENAVQDRDVEGKTIARYDFAKRHPVALWSAEDGVQQLHADALGSIVATSASDGQLKSETLYDAWGKPTSQEGASANKFAYTGHQADAETGLYYFKARYYDPEIGRFISEDPAQGLEAQPASYHRYLYAFGNPNAYVDPDGRFAGTVTVGVTGFFWGFGQMLGGMINDGIDGKVRTTREYLGVWGQNIVGGMEVGASFDAAVLSGGTGWMASGALGGAGSNALTVGGQGDSAAEFLKGQAVGGATGAVTGGVLGKLVPVVGKLGGALVDKATRLAEKLPVPVKEASSSVFNWTRAKLTDAVTAVGNRYRYVRTEADETIANISQTLRNLVTREGAAVQTGAEIAPASQ